MRLRLQWLLLVAILATLVLPSALSAQAWLEDRQRTEGRGIRVGAFALHPGIGAEGGYDSNVFLAADNEDEPALSSGIVRVAPHFYISTREVDGDTPPAIRLRAGVSAAGKYYFNPGEFNIGVGEDFALTINPERPFSAELRQSYKLSQDPFTEPAGPGSGGEDAEFNFDRHQLSVGPYFQLATPGGLLKGGLGYTFTLDSFADEQFETNDTQKHTVLADSSWEFLPKTALFWKGSVGFRSYDRNDDLRGVERNDSTEYASRLGVNGGLTAKVSFTLAAGYSALDYDDDFGAEGDGETVTAQAELRWRPEKTMLVVAGYEREINSAFQGNFATLNRIKARSGLLFGGVFLLALRGEVTFVDYGRDDAAIMAGATGLDEDGERSDVHVLANLSGEYRFTDWFALTAELGYLTNITDFAYAPITDTSGMVVGTGDAAEYQRVEAWLGLRAFL